MQKEIIINNVKVQVIEENEVEYYPMKYMFQKVMLRTTKANVLGDKEEYKKSFKHFDVDYGRGTGGIQNVSCISREGIIKYLSNPKSIQLGRLNTEQKLALNSLLTYFELKIDNYINTYEIDIYIQDCIDNVVNEYDNIKFKTCTSCGHIYPIHENFFNKNNRDSDDGLTNVCRKCNGRGIRHIKLRKQKIYNDYGLKGYKLFKNDIVKYYDKHIFKTEERPPIELCDKNNYFKLIKHYYDKGVITKENISKEYLEETFNITLLRVHIDIHDVYEKLFGEDYKYHPWEYKNIKQRDITFEDCKIILNNYIEQNNIIINDIFNCNYDDILSKAKIRYRTQEDMLGFVVKYYNSEYAGYLFKTNAKNYYKKEENRILDMKYLIEKDMKIPIEKIPLYLTKFSLRKKSSSLYFLLHGGKYYKNLFEWIDNCYKDKFILADFEINAYRNEFDSLEEGQVDDILHNNFDNVIYNQNNCERTIKIEGKVPDWFIFTSNGCYMIEYFGLYVERENSSIVDDYRKRTDSKLEKYKKLKGYKFLGIYPEDLLNNFEGVLDKIKTIV